MITIEEIMSYEPCSLYTKKRVKELWAGRESLNPREIAKLQIPHKDRVWALCQCLAHRDRSAIITFARDCARRAAARAASAGWEAEWTAKATWGAEWTARAARAADAAIAAADAAAYADAAVGASERQRQLDELVGALETCK